MLKAFVYGCFELFVDQVKPVPEGIPWPREKTSGPGTGTNHDHYQGERKIQDLVKFYLISIFRFNARQTFKSVAK
jgi:hypothetical protein